MHMQKSDEINEYNKEEKSATCSFMRKCKKTGKLTQVSMKINPLHRKRKSTMTSKAIRKKLGGKASAYTVRTVHRYMRTLGMTFNDAVEREKKTGTKRKSASPTLV